MNTSQEKILFEKCCNNGISIENIDQPFYHQKFNVLASSIDMELKEAPKDFLLRMTDQKEKEKNSKDEAQHKELLLKQQRENKIAAKKYSRFSDLYGSEKPIEMISADFDEKIQVKQKEYEAAIKEVKKYDGYVQTSLQFNQLMRGSERDWAIAGGIASGIAGPAAGIANALDAQVHNASVRASNAALDHQTALELVGIEGFKVKAKDKAKRILKEITELENKKNQEIEQCKTTVVGDQPDEEVFEYLKVENAKCYIQTTGSVLVNVRVSCKNDCNVFGNTNAHVDGTLTGQIYQDGHLIGVADLVSPLSGIQSYGTSLSGLSLCHADPSKDCTIVISPKNLWTVEN